MAFNFIRRVFGWFGRNDQSGTERPITTQVSSDQTMPENTPEELRDKGFQPKPITLNVEPLKEEPTITPHPIEPSEEGLEPQKSNVESAAPTSTSEKIA